MMKPNADNIIITPVGERDKKLHRQFIGFSHSLYKNNKYWVPLFNVDMKSYLQKKHPYFMTYPAQFFIAHIANKVCGTICVSYNKNYYAMHKINTAHFSFFDFIDNIEVARKLLDTATEWARQYGATVLSGPFFNGGGSGVGMLYQGFDVPASMTMMRYNYEYYNHFMTELGYTKLVDLNSYYTPRKKITADPRVQRISDIIKKRGGYEIHRFKNKKEIFQLAQKMIFDFFNELLGDHYENYPMEPAELERLLVDIKLVIRKDLFLILKETVKNSPIGYSLGFPNITSALQQSKGKLTPLSILRILSAVKHPKSVILNGVGILKDYEGRGGSALLYYETFLKIISLNKPSIGGVEFIQISEHTDVLVSNLGQFIDKLSKIHRLYQKEIGAYRRTTSNQ